MPGKKETTTRSYRFEPAMIDAFDQWRAAFGWGAEECVAAALFFIMGLEPAELGPLRLMFNRWLAGGCQLDQDKRVPDQFRPGASTALPADVNELIGSLPEAARARWQAKLRAFADFLQQEKRQKRSEVAGRRHAI